MAFFTNYKVLIETILKSIFYDIILLTMKSEHLENILSQFNPFCIEEEYSVSNIQSDRVYSIAIPLLCWILSPLCFAFGMFNWYIDLVLILLSNILLFHTIFTYRYSINDFFITDIKIAHQNKLLWLVKTKHLGDGGPADGVNWYVDVKNLLREYEISKILNIECIVKDITNSNEHWKRPLLIRYENIKLILKINIENRSDEYSIYFKYNEECYDKISEIINLLKRLKVFNYKFENVDKTLFKITQ